MQKGQWSCQKDVSLRRLLLPQWLTQPLLPAFTRPQERQLSGFSLLLLHRNSVSETLSCRSTARQGLMYVQLLWSIYSACSQKCAWGLGWEIAEHCAPFAAWIHQPQQLSFYSLPQTHGSVTVRSIQIWHVFTTCYFPCNKGRRLFPGMENAGLGPAPQLRDHKPL